jgi:hypothetical protein
MEEKDKTKDKKDNIPDDIAAAIAVAVMLHRAGPESAVVLFGNGELDEGAGGRSARAGMGGATSHRARRD